MRSLLTLGLAFTSAIIFAGAAVAGPTDIVRISETSNASESNGASAAPTVSDTGSLVAFQSSASNLIDLDQNDTLDVFLYNRGTETTTLVSFNSDGNPANGPSGLPEISSDGSYIVFMSLATNLVTTPPGSFSNVYLLDRSVDPDTITKISQGVSDQNIDNNCTSASVSDDGKFIAFACEAANIVSPDGNGFSDIFLYDVDGDTTTLVSRKEDDALGDGASFNPRISSTGQYTVFESAATNLVDNDQNGVSDIFIFDRDAPDAASRLARITVNSSSAEGNGASVAPSISSGGRWVVFSSLASNLVTGDTNGASDIFLYDSNDSSITKISASSAGANTNGHSVLPSISADGTAISFLSDATNIVTDDDNNAPGDGKYDVFVYESSGGTTARTSVKTQGSDATGSADSAALDSDGSVCALSSIAPLIPGDTNGFSDIFVTDLACPTDSDSDSTVDCSDECPFDAAKTDAGSCGCGTAETDSDADGTADCVDLCPSDVNKTAAGTCGCGTADTDSNGNGAADCLDPTTQTKPVKLRVRVTRNGVVIVNIPPKFAGVTYNISVRRNGQRVRSISTTNTETRIRNLRSGGYNISYKIVLDEITTRASGSKSVTVP